MKEALFYTSLDKDDKVQCHLCPHNCIIAPNKTGICRQRKNQDGKLYSLIYGQVTSLNLDPIEKKPLYHFYPGTKVLSVGTNGCNFACPYCQNWTISQKNSATEEMTPAEVIKLAHQYKSPGISYTYNEPSIWYEFVLDCARLAHQEGLTNNLVTNGFINPEPLAELLPYIDAMNIDLKSIQPEFYRRLCKGRLEPVLETCKTAKPKALIEITNLIIPGENDRAEDIEDLSRWVAKTLGKATPIHFSAYYPTYQFSRSPTPIETLIKAYEMAKQHLAFVYLGNVPTKVGNDTFCQKCNTKLVERRGFNTRVLNLSADGKCKSCGADNNFRV